MHTTLLESDRSFFQSAECAFVSILAHAGVVWLCVAATQGGRHLPSDEREARVFFLLPPDRVDVQTRQTENIQWGRLGQDLQNGKYLMPPGDDLGFREPTFGARRPGRESGARAELPFGPTTPFVPDSAFSVLEVDKMVERYEESAAPVYPRDLLAVGVQGFVHAIYVVDTTGRVDTTTIKVVESDDPRFTASVLDALGLMRFRPARRAGRSVRQLVEQNFRFRIVPSSEVAKQVS
ncbi:MAG TPA: energy transducer TonB [Gemmatimonadales bacterium]|jgi:TonB family protein